MKWTLWTPHRSSRRQLHCEHSPTAFSELWNTKRSFAFLPCENLKQKQHWPEMWNSFVSMILGKKEVALLLLHFVTDEKGASEASTQFFGGNGRSGIRSLSANLVASVLCKRSLSVSLRRTIFLSLCITL